MLFVPQSSTTLKAESIKVYLAGIQSLHLENGFLSPLSNCLRLERVLRGIKRTQRHGQRQRLPITFSVLRRIHGILNLSIFDDALFWAACCTGFYGFLRSGEFTTKTKTFDPETNLALSDIKVDRYIEPTVLLVSIKCSKTDPFRKGYTLRLGVSRSEVCAVKAVLHYLHMRGGGEGPLFQHQNGLPLTRSKLTFWLREAVPRAGLQGNYSGHSFRIGAASTAAEAGVPDHLIKTMGRWTSNAYQLYIHTPPEVLVTMAARMAGQH